MDHLALPDGATTLEPYGVSEDKHGAPPMLDFRGHNAVSCALPYQHLAAMVYHPVEGITMEFREHRIAIRGRNLRPLYDQLLRHRVTFVQEEDFDATPESETFVDAITVERLHELG